MNARLRQSNHIHITFNRDNGLGWLATLRLAGFTRTKAIIKHATFMEELSFRGIQIFRRRISGKRTPPESDDTSTQVLNREHDAITEAIIGNSDALAMNDKTASLDLLFRNAFGCQKFLERIARFRTIADAECLLRRTRKTAITQISARLRAQRTL